MSRQRMIPEPIPLERTIQMAMMEWLRWQRYWVLRQNSGARPNPTGKLVRFGKTGLPDLLVLKDGRYVWIEVKRPGETPRPEQREMHAELRHYGATVIVATSVDDLATQLSQQAMAA